MIHQRSVKFAENGDIIFANSDQKLVQFVGELHGIGTERCECTYTRKYVYLTTCKYTYTGTNTHVYEYVYVYMLKHVYGILA